MSAPAHVVQGDLVRRCHSSRTSRVHPTRLDKSGVVQQFILSSIDRVGVRWYIVTVFDTVWLSKAIAIFLNI